MTEPESEVNPPEDRKPGYKPWPDGRERWWAGSQWTETYRGEAK